MHFVPKLVCFTDSCLFCNIIAGPCCKLSHGHCVSCGRLYRFSDPMLLLLVEVKLYIYIDIYTCLLNRLYSWVRTVCYYETCIIKISFRFLLLFNYGNFFFG